MIEALSIREVAPTIGVSVSTLRHWEKEFENYLSISRDKFGGRVYTKKDIKRFQMIRSMRKKGLSITAIRTVLDASRDKENLDQDLLHTVNQQISTALEERSKTSGLQEQVLQPEVYRLWLSSMEKFQHQLQIQIKKDIKQIIQQEITKVLEYNRETTRELEEAIESQFTARTKRPWWRLWRQKKRRADRMK